MDRITDFLSDLPIGLIIFIIAMAFGMFGKDSKEQPDAPRQASRQPEPPLVPSTFASDDRRAREERAARRQEQPREVITFGGLEFGSSDALFRDDEEVRRDTTKFGFDRSEWGQTKYGFDESEWGSSFGDKKNPDPIIR